MDNNEYEIKLADSDKTLFSESNPLAAFRFWIEARKKSLKVKMTYKSGYYKWLFKEVVDQNQESLAARLHVTPQEAKEALEEAIK